MRIAYFDCSFGASGDMLLGACLDAGEALGFGSKELTDQLELLGLPPAEFSLSLEKVHRAGIFASHLNVHLQENVLSADSKASDPRRAVSHSHGHGHGHGHEHGHEHEHEHGKQPGRRHQEPLRRRQRQRGRWRRERRA